MAGYWWEKLDEVGVLGGRVVHVKECSECTGEGGGNECFLHGGHRCDCRGSFVECDYCEGTGLEFEENCDCDRCVVAEEGRAA